MKKAQSCPSGSPSLMGEPPARPLVSQSNEWGISLSWGRPQSDEGTAGHLSLQMKSWTQSCYQGSTQRLYNHRTLKKATKLLCSRFAAPIQDQSYPHPALCVLVLFYGLAHASGEPYSLRAAPARLNSMHLITPASQRAVVFTQDRPWALGNSAKVFQLCPSSPNQIPSMSQSKHIRWSDTHLKQTTAGLRPLE
jgi:hypothetical protein